MLVVQVNGSHGLSSSSPHPLSSWSLSHLHCSTHCPLHYRSDPCDSVLRVPPCCWFKVVVCCVSPPWAPLNELWFPASFNSVIGGCLGQFGRFQTCWDYVNFLDIRKYLRMKCLNCECKRLYSRNFCDVWDCPYCFEYSSLTVSNINCQGHVRGNTLHP